MAQYYKKDISNDKTLINKMKMSAVYGRAYFIYDNVVYSKDEDTVSDMVEISQQEYFGVRKLFKVRIGL